MNRQKCEHCGLVNQASEQTCRRCSQRLGAKWEPIDLNWTPPKKKRSLSIMPLLLIAGVTGIVYGFWQFKPESGPQRTASVPAANAVPVEKPILHAAVEPANADQQTAGIRATFENSKIINDANKRVDDLNKLMGTPNTNAKK